MKPAPFRADHVGSLIRPDYLIEARNRHANGEIDADELTTIQQKAIREVVALQEGLGLKSITDGEYNRGSWHTDFLLRFENVEPWQSKYKTTFHNEQGTVESKPHTVRVAGKLARPKPIFVEDFKYLKSVTKETPKITIPSPSIMHFRGGREAIDTEAYPTMEEFYADLAAVYAEEIGDLIDAGCRYLQIDETNFAYLCDPSLRAQVQTSIGEDPDELPHVYARLINAAIAARPDDMAVCMHVCRGNFAGRWVAEGGYEPIADVMFNELNIDGYFLEYDSDRAGGFEPLRFVPKGKTVVLGLVTTKRGQMESADELKRRIEEASKFVSIDQLALSPQCGFSSGIGGNTMGIEDEKQKLALVVKVAEEVWG
ncbi:5-methyltetrahydropteroyltriglutamate--homocysteine S-methyltransferase [Sphingobium lignivorans]|uniref:5-methyltetrahydropteroyltriglutamate--homocysteine methyltransferase n=1 Tax=Sphingobium lignivorans TaxID=2735886 RepID=A0ABR6NBY4_9SPHN|nr:5-methyltetrahydropteroyltriglutamate--homocysteine S-methyltransferase [Sphingobium lignivorans]MBB5984783.1 5-methyltetrahydropteroyltriglutamate--homocysteine methyltransferase [Sphingobium lignivorans]